MDTSISNGSEANRDEDNPNRHRSGQVHVPCLRDGAVGEGDFGEGVHSTGAATVHGRAGTVRGGPRGVRRRRALGAVAERHGPRRVVDGPAVRQGIPGAVITLLVSRRLLLAVQERLRRTPYKMPEQRWAAIFAAAAPAILDIVVLPPRVSKVIARRLESMLLHEAPDPNRSRQLLFERVECGAAWA